MLNLKFPSNPVEGQLTADSETDRQFVFYGGVWLEIVRPEQREEEWKVRIEDKLNKIMCEKDLEVSLNKTLDALENVRNLSVRGSTLDDITKAWAEADRVLELYGRKKKK